MAETRTIRVQIEGLEDLKVLVRELRRAAESLEKAGRVGQDAARAINGAVQHGQRSA